MDLYHTQADHDAYREKIRALRSTDHPPITASRQTQNYRNTFTVTYDPQVAADRLVGSLKKKVMSGEMTLPDVGDWSLLNGGVDLRDVDVLVDFKQLKVLLEELFFYYRPGARRAHQPGRKVVWGVGQARGMGPGGGWLRPLPPALSPEQADELMCELHQWGRANSPLFLQARYMGRPEKLGMLLREGE
eukprot:CAMPEP_0173246332 /NCGR_PEP_ID=MMETSP1142-20121109/17258_1 /TAXON_ID=483371 /ORGANISM="non described non described, Strain CCMP2298" /LENGTH=188 /DNA_ID=CAMNT_0014178543 /DNA_START=29 /DNA_END=592 /DNA_ORIENTATION=+